MDLYDILFSSSIGKKTGRFITKDGRVILIGGPSSGGGSSISTTTFNPSNAVTNAITDYTNLVDYTKKPMLDLIERNDVGLQELSDYTASQLQEAGYEKLHGIHLTQYPGEINLDQINGQVIDINDVFSLSTGEGPQEYSKYRYEIKLSDIPLDRVIAHSGITPELFPISSENEFITRRMRAKVTSINNDNPDRTIIHLRWVNDNTPLQAGIDKSDPDWWRAFLVKD